MQILNPIYTDRQIFNVLEGIKPDEQKAVKNKIEIVKKQLSKITHINGSKVYHCTVIEDNIFYSLTKCPDNLLHFLKHTEEREYYYPIQYAKITFQS